MSALSEAMRHGLDVALCVGAAIVALTLEAAHRRQKRRRR